MRREKPYHAQGADKKGGHGNRHSASDADHFADVLLAGGHSNSSGTKEESDLAEGVHGDMNHAADESLGGKQGRPKTMYES